MFKNMLVIKIQSETVGDVFVFYFHGVTLLFFIFF